MMDLAAQRQHNNKVDCPQVSASLGQVKAAKQFRGNGRYLQAAEFRKAFDHEIEMKELMENTQQIDVMQHWQPESRKELVVV